MDVTLTPEEVEVIQNHVGRLDYDDDQEIDVFGIIDQKRGIQTVRVDLLPSDILEDLRSGFENEEYECLHTVNGDKCKLMSFRFYDYPLVPLRKYED